MLEKKFYLNTILILFLLILFYRNVYGDSGNVMRLTNLKCKGDNEVVNYTMCRLKLYNRTMTTLNIEVVMKRQMKQPIMNFKLFKNANGYKPFLIDVSFDMCAFLNGRRVTLFTPFFNLMRPYTNVLQPCPLPKVLHFKNFPLEAKNIPSTWPSGNYRADMKAIESDHVVSIVNTYLSIHEKDN